MRGGQTVELSYEFYIKNSTTVHVKMTINGELKEGDCTGTFNGGVCKIIIPSTFSPDGSSYELCSLYTGDGLVPAEEVIEYESLPTYPAPLIIY